MKYHVRVYQVALQGEVNVEADSEQAAKALALEMARKGEVSLRFPDCGCLALSFKKPEKDISVVDFNYYRTVLQTQYDPEKLRSEMNDLIQEAEAVILSLYIENDLLKDKK